MLLKVSSICNKRNMHDELYNMDSVPMILTDILII